MKKSMVLLTMAMLGAGMSVTAVPAAETEQAVTTVSLEAFLNELLGGKLSADGVEMPEDALTGGETEAAAEETGEKSGNGSLVLTVGPGGQMILSSSVGADDDFSWVNGISADGAYETADGDTRFAGDLSFNGVSLTDVQAHYLKDSNVLYLSLPGLSSQTVALDLAKLGEEVSSMATEDSGSVSLPADLEAEAQDYIEKLTGSDEQLNALLQKLGGVLAGNTADPTVTEVQLSAGNMTEPGACYTLAWNGEQMEAIIQQGGDILLSDEFVKTLLDHPFIDEAMQLAEESSSDTSAEDYADGSAASSAESFAAGTDGAESEAETEAEALSVYEQFYNAVSQFLATTDISEDMADGSINLDVYTVRKDGKSEFAGISVYADDGTGQMMDIYRTVALEGETQSAFEIDYGEAFAEAMEFEESFKIVGDFAKTGEEWNGTVDVQKDAESLMTATVEHFTASEDGKEFSGIFTVPIQTDDGTAFEIKADLDVKKDSSNATVDVSTNGIGIATVDLAGSNGTGDFQIADFDESNVYEIANTRQLLGYVIGFDFEGLFGKLESAGVPSAYIEQLQASLNGESTSAQ